MAGKRPSSEAESAGDADGPFELWRRVKPRASAVLEKPALPATSSARRVFDRTLTLDTFVGREEDRSFLVFTITKLLTQTKAGAVYMSGLPGTGKTALMHVVRADLLSGTAPPHRFVIVNCMQLASARQIFGRIFDDDSEDDADLPRRLAKQAVVLVLDEMDSLVSRDNDVIYRLFELTRLPSSRLVLVGVANTLDLIDRRLPRLAAHACRPVQMSIRAYTADELLKILNERQARLPSPVVEQSALELCARKVAAKHGDARKALDIVFQALEAWETRHGENAPPLPIVALHSVLMASYATEQVRRLATLPLLAKRVLCAMFAIAHRKQPVPLDDLKKVYHEQWASEAPGAPPAPRCSRDEFKTMCEPLVNVGVLGLAGKRPDEWRLVNVNLRDEDVQDALEDDEVLTAMLKQALDRRKIR